MSEVLGVYTLRAFHSEIGDVRVSIEADNDDEAIFEASFAVMDRAIGGNVWAKGRVELSNPQGEVIQVMEAK